jgi:fatty-acyl-CoA synthase
MTAPQTLLIFHSSMLDAATALKELTGLKNLLVIGDGKHGRSGRHPGADGCPNDEEPVPDTPPDLDTPHIIMYTAGTTGQPKGAVLSQGASFWNAVNLTVDMGFTAADRNLAVLPCFISAASACSPSPCSMWAVPSSYRTDL